MHHTDETQSATFLAQQNFSKSYLHISNDILQEFEASFKLISSPFAAATETYIAR